MELVHAWSGWLTRVAFFAYAAASLEFVWFVRVSIGPMGIHLLLYWLLERMEVQRGENLMRLRKALLPLMFAGPLLLVAGSLVWLTATR